MQSSQDSRLGWFQIGRAFAKLDAAKRRHDAAFETLNNHLASVPPADQAAVRRPLAKWINGDLSTDEFAEAVERGLSEPAAASPLDWAGDWETSYGRLTLQVLESGELSGEYGEERHRLSGRFESPDARRIVGQWTHAGDCGGGSFRFRMVRPGQWQGEWVDDGADFLGVTNWIGQRPVDAF